MPESKVPFRTGPLTASEGIQETVVTEDSMRMEPSLVVRATLNDRAAPVQG